jgi:hypothetical protein
MEAPESCILGRPMWRRLRVNPLLLWTVVLAVLAARLTDTHLHLCFDGQEAPTSVHLADASVHHDEDHDGGTGHADKDVDPFVGTLVKSDDDSQPLFAFIVSTLLTIDLLPPDHAVPALDPETPLATSPPFYLRPPLRGPPV